MNLNLDQIKGKSSQIQNQEYIDENSPYYPTEFKSNEALQIDFQKKNQLAHIFTKAIPSPPRIGGNGLKRKQSKIMKQFMQLVGKNDQIELEQEKRSLYEVFQMSARRVWIILQFYNMLREMAENNINQKKNSKKDENMEFIHRRSGIFPLYPSDLFLAFWNLFLIIMLVLTALLTPIRVSLIDDDDQLWNQIDIFFDIFFTCDMIVHFLSAYYDQSNKLQVGWRDIIVNYATGWFFIDLVGVFPFQYILVGEGSKYNKLFRLLRLPQLYNLTKLVQMSKGRNLFILKIFEFFSLAPAAQKLVKILIMMLSMTHFVACIWYFTSKWDDYSSETWVHRKDLEDSPFSTKYITSYYWAFQTLTVVGYGDIESISFSQQLVAILWMLIGVVFYSFTIGNIASTILDMNIKGTFFNQIMDELQDVVMMCHVPETLSENMSRFFQTNYSNNHFWGINKEQIFLGLPYLMRQQITLLVYSQLIEKVNFLKIDLVFSSDILPRAYFYKLNPDEILYRRDDPSEQVFIIASGQIAFIDEDLQILFQAEQGDIVGEIEAIENIKRLYWAYCLTDVMLIVVQQKFFLDKVNEYEMVKETVYRRQKIQQSILQYQRARMENMQAKIQRAIVTPAVVKDRRNLRLKFQFNYGQKTFFQIFDSRQYLRKGILQSDQNRLILISQVHYKLFLDCFQKEQKFMQLIKLAEKRQSIGQIIPINQSETIDEKTISNMHGQTLNTEFEDHAKPLQLNSPQINDISSFSQAIFQNHAFSRSTKNSQTTLMSQRKGSVQFSGDEAQNQRILFSEEDDTKNIAEQYDGSESNDGYTSDTDENIPKIIKSQEMPDSIFGANLRKIQQNFFQIAQMKQNLQTVQKLAIREKHRLDQLLNQI